MKSSKFWEKNIIVCVKCKQQVNLLPVSINFAIDRQYGCKCGGGDWTAMPYTLDQYGCWQNKAEHSFDYWIVVKLIPEGKLKGELSINLKRIGMGRKK